MDKGHWCGTHETPFFKGGKMKGYAHPIEGTDPTEWCNEMTAEALPPATEPRILPEHQEAIEQSKAQVAPKETGKYKADPAKTQSIERQSALKSAVQWLGIKVQDGQDLRSVDVIVCATLFEAYLTNGATVNKKEVS